MFSEQFKIGIFIEDCVTMLFAKKIFLFILFVLLSFGFILHRQINYLSGYTPSSKIDTATCTLRTVKNEAFKRGEFLKYRLHYGFINAGEATLKITDEIKQVAGRNTLHVVGNGITANTFDWFFKVRDKYESYIDEEAIVPWVFIRRVNEGGYKIEQNQIFNHFKNTMDMNGKKFDVVEGVQDMTSAFYFARTIDFSNAKVGDVFQFPCFVDDQVWPIRMKYMGKDTINSDLGRIRCIKFHPVVQQGRIFKRENDLNAWITDDKNRIPVRVEAKVLVGSIKMDLTEYSGLVNQLAFEPKEK